MVKPRPPKPPSGKTNLASCILATTFIIFIVILILIVFFTLFNPKSPTISVNAINLPSFSVTNGTTTLTFSLYASVTNPNRVPFSHYDSSLQLLYAGNQLGFMFVPAGEIAAGRSQLMAATFSVRPFTMSVGPTGAGQEIEIESKMRLVGKVRVLHLFAHHVEAISECRVAVSLSDGNVLSFHC